MFSAAAATRLLLGPTRCLSSGRALGLTQLLASAPSSLLPRAAPIVRLHARGLASSPSSTASAAVRSVSEEQDGQQGKGKDKQDEKEKGGLVRWARKKGGWALALILVGGLFEAWCAYEYTFGAPRSSQEKIFPEANQVRAHMPSHMRQHTHAPDMHTSKHTHNNAHKAQKHTKHTKHKNRSTKRTHKSTPNTHTQRPEYIHNTPTLTHHIYSYPHRSSSCSVAPTTLR